jgi:hypothetical protein
MNTNEICGLQIPLISYCTFLRKFEGSNGISANKFNISVNLLLWWCEITLKNN